MSRPIKSSKKNKFPKGWNERRVRRLIDHYENQSDESAAAEDDDMFKNSQHTFMQIPVKLVPAVRKLLSKRAS
jgi:hypothetical protein